MRLFSFAAAVLAVTLPSVAGAATFTPDDEARIVGLSSPEFAPGGARVALVRTVQDTARIGVSGWSYGGYMGDARVPVTQSFRMYRILEDNNRPVRFIGILVDGHNPGDIVRRIERERVWTDWAVQGL